MKRRVLVLGCGSIGRRHIGNLRKLGCEVSAYDADPSRARWARRNLGCETVDAPERALDAKPGAVWVCTPPHLHAEAARQALGRGIACFIEKPLAHSEADARAIAELARKTKTPAAVGYMMRFHPALRWLKARLDERRWGRLLYLRAQVGQYLPDWRPWQDYRRSYTARRSQGGGVLRDSSHEIDLARWLGGEVAAVSCAAVKVSRLDIDVEDAAALTLSFRSGALGEVHLDMVSRPFRRNLEVACEEGSACWDQPSSTLSLYSAKTKRWTRKTFRFDANSLYLDEARAFLDGGGGLVSPADAARTMAVVAAAERSARTRRQEKLPK